MVMKNIPLLLNHCSELLAQWIDETAPLRGADKIKQQYFQERRYLGSKDRRLIGDLYYDIIRNLRLYEWQIQKNISTDTDHVPADLLVVHAYQQHFPDEVQNIIFNIEDGISHYFTHYRYKDQLPQHPPIRWSIPDVLWDRIHVHYTEEEIELCLAEMNKPATVHLRTNTMKISPSELQHSCKDLSLQSGNISPDALRMDKRSNLNQHSMYRRGMFEFQDESSQLVAFVCNPKKDDVVIDLCAGAGGKTLHLASLRSDSGTLVATDRYPKRLKELARRAKRAGLQHISLMSFDEMLPRFVEKADILLIDVPCSGSGVYGRHPDKKWELSKEKLQNYLRIQHDILNDYAKLVKPGGFLVYATCSIIPDENEKQVETFLSQHPEFALYSVYKDLSAYGIQISHDNSSKMLSILPQHFLSEGFFISKMIKK